MQTPQRSAKEQFDRQAKHYNVQWNSWSEENLRWLLENAECKPSDTVLDVATGTGFTALAFAPHVSSIVGLDVSSGMLAQARQKAIEQQAENVTFQEGTAESLPFPEGSFDKVVCRVAPHHFLSVPQFLSEAFRVLKHDGLLLITDTSVPDDAPELDYWQNHVELLRDPSHVRNYTPTEWGDFVVQAGFTLEALSDTGGKIALTLEDWLMKSGCAGETAQTVRDCFTGASEAVKAAYQIETLPDGDIRFIWKRVVLKARKV